MVKRQISNSFVVIVVIAVLLSFYILIADRVVSVDTKNIIVSSDAEADAGYIRLIRNDLTPSALDRTSFEDGRTFHYFSLSGNEAKRIRISYEGVSEGRQYVDYEVVYVSGKTVQGTLSFR